MFAHKRLSRKWFVPFTVLALLIAAVLLLTSGSMSQAIGRQDTAGPSSENNLSEPVWALTTDIDAGAPDEPTGPRPLIPLAPTTTYYKIPGVGFQPRNSATTYEYMFGTGCIRRLAGTENFSTVLPIPDGSVVKYIRIYTNNSAAGPAGVGFLTRYNMSGTSEDVASVTASSLSSYNAVSSAVFPHSGLR
jgi:hypothetical protein